MSGLTKEDQEMLKSMPTETLLNLFNMQIRNLWRVDGLYFLGIEERFGTEAATQIDSNCWKTLGKLEARELKSLLQIQNNDISALMYALRNTSWSLYQEEKQIEESLSIGVYRVTKCRVQEARISKALDVFPCKNVRFSYLKAFVEEFNPSIKVNCRFAPTEERPKNVWCEWEFKL
ncbi:MAG TPA: DUF6125 family protein [Candidatus Bathyarchaeia archaeon]|nr:DUF6125 family protein [Candidatus Bathyarchaeia archaeon]